MGLNCFKARATLRRQFTFYLQFPRNFWYSFYLPQKDETESTLELPSRFDHGTPGLGIQSLNHWAIAPEGNILHGSKLNQKGSISFIAP